jgi:hypothetical protein
MHMCDICCVETICGSIFGDSSVILFVCTFRTVIFTVVILLKFL